ncbi:TPA: type I restriction enzyme HsdR N-terminal domain-containing protein, partial [Neisseria gonorrhoeae]
GFSAFDPNKVRAEYQADFPGAKSGERVDYALFCNGAPVMFIEAKSYTENLSNHCPQLSRYFNATPEIAICAITNGREWRFFT